MSPVDGKAAKTSIVKFLLVSLKKPSILGRFQLLTFFSPDMCVQRVCCWPSTALFVRAFLRFAGCQWGFHSVVCLIVCTHNIRWIVRTRGTSNLREKMCAVLQLWARELQLCAVKYLFTGTENQFILPLFIFWPFFCCFILTRFSLHMAHTIFVSIQRSSWEIACRVLGYGRRCWEWAWLDFHQQKKRNCTTKTGKKAEKFFVFAI